MLSFVLYATIPFNTHFTPEVATTQSIQDNPTIKCLEDNERAYNTREIMNIVKTTENSDIQLATPFPFSLFASQWK